ncbi:MAG: nicotinic acid mononucleotide adenylyltransferase [Devosia sp. 67-54]|uniref:nicotinate-nucleotide adenylyltransferase n=1 Tax=unclassified Devosia TaxID=196773 RepID=UPI000965ED29|nr:MULTISPECIES: nicotinate-nucleotide adenylyltransferase [unclassified Devosia]MBN9307198.1 nicotinate-nucleotide adenylyltransferase [Devosia sp.]OJX19593.1 MAG: nicotinic acid mononucleotide adenylyltransferase [Devosia sp. 67-54]
MAPPDRLQVPHAEPGMRIGLFGGSFNPPHEGHRLVALQCLKRLRLDRVWVLVSPGNPLKDHAELAPLETRIEQTAKMMDDPRLVVTGFEAAHHFAYTYQTVRYLHETHPGVRFVWMMGADSLAGFDRWEHWQRIADTMPMAIYARPGSALRATKSPAAATLDHARVAEKDAARLADTPAPAWVYLRGMMSSASSTALRRARAKAPAAE